MTLGFRFNPFTGNFDLVTTSLPATAITGLTAGSVIFADSTGLAQDNANLFWNDTTNKLGIKTNSPNFNLDVRGEIGLTGFGNSLQLITSPNFASHYQSFMNLFGNLIIGLESSSGGQVFTGATAYAGLLGTYGATSVLQFATNNTVQATIDLTGKLGIGTASPSALLDVNGSTRLRALSTGVLHSDSSGNITSSAVVLTSEVSGVLPIANGGTNLSTYTTGDTLYASATNVLSKLAIGSSNTVLTVSGGIPAWSLVSLTASVSGALPIANGGTGQTTKAAAFDALSPMTTGGDLIYGGASGTGTRLANGTSGQVLTSNGTTTAPSWQTPTSSTKNTAEYMYQETNGGGSTNTKVRKYANQQIATDPSGLLTVSNSATLGFSVTANRACMLTVTYSDLFSGLDQAMILTKNGTELTTSPFSITNHASVLAFTEIALGDYMGCVSATVPAVTNDVIRPQSSTVTDSSVKVRGVIYVSAIEI